MLLLIGYAVSAADANTPTDLRNAMRTWIIDISTIAKSSVPGFVVIAQNGEELIALGDSVDDPLATDYLQALDGLGREDLFYGYTTDDEPTPLEATDHMLSYLDRAQMEGIHVLAIDYCSTPEHVRASYDANAAHGFVSFAAPRRALDVIPIENPFPVNCNESPVTDLTSVRNFLYLINPEGYPDRDELTAALASLPVDLLIVDADAEDGPLTADDVERMKWKPGGARRLVLCYLSIGEAEDYRGYWNPGWSDDPPDWLLAENPNWPGNYTVRYWDVSWQAIIYVQLECILAAGFDGVYLDCVDVYERFEN
jgi:cysteinyl-tRNA synthetase